MIDTPFSSPLNWTSPRAGQQTAATTSVATSTTRTALLVLTFATTLLVGCNDKKSARDATGTSSGTAPTGQSGEREGDDQGDDQGAGMMGRREGRDDGAMDSTHRGGADHRGMMHRGMGMGRKHMGM